MKTIKLTFKERWNKFWGFGYRVNIHTKEIHRLSDIHINCLPSIKDLTMYVSKKTANMLIEKKKFNGCRWCWEEKDTDKR